MKVNICIYMLCTVECSEAYWLYFRTFLQSVKDSFNIKNTCFVESQVGIFSMFVILVLTITQSLLQIKFFVSSQLSCFIFLKSFLSLALPFTDNIYFEICYSGKDICIEILMWCLMPVFPNLWNHSFSAFFILHPTGTPGSSWEGAKLFAPAHLSSVVFNCNLAYFML